MISSGEFSRSQPKSPYEQDVWVRNQSIAEGIGTKRFKEFEREVLELAGAYPKLVNINALAEASGDVYRLAVRNAIEERQAGLLNDDCSVAPGIFITGLLDRRRVEQLKRELELRSVEFDLQTCETDEMDWHYSLHLPRGTFEYDPEFLVGYDAQQPISQRRLYISPFAEVQRDGFIQKRGPNFSRILSGGYIDQAYQNATGRIGRIEGAEGRLWQNPQTSPDGSSKQELTQAA